MLRQLLHPVRNNRGMALMVAISAVALMVYIATEVMYDTTVEYNVNAQELNRLKAYYSARGAVELGMLRVKVYQQVKNQLGENAKNIPFLDQIWNFPFQWPFPAALLEEPEEEKEEDEKSLFDTEYSLIISDEGSKIDLNDLNSPAEELRKNAEKLLLNIFEERILNDENFRRQYGTFKFQDLINHMKDWMSDKWISQAGGDKRVQYADFQSQELPPNRAFRTIGELRLLPLMDDTLFELLQSRVTIYGLKGVNPNTATASVLRSLDPGITKDIAEKVITQREKTPFASAEQFFTFLLQEGARLEVRDAKDLPLTFETLTSFRITAEGRFGNVSRTITAIVTDINGTASRIKEFTDKQNQANNPNPNPNPNANPNPPKKPTQTLPKGPPRIVYWYEN